MNENIERVLAELDGFRMCDQMDYDAYSRLHDSISELDDLLKAQEARLMTLEELQEYLMLDISVLSSDQWRELLQKEPLYVEYKNGSQDEYHPNWWVTERLRAWCKTTVFMRKYNKERRCWTARPTDEQREATPWN